MDEGDRGALSIAVVTNPNLGNDTYRQMIEVLLGDLSPARVHGVEVSDPDGVHHSVLPNDVDVCLLLWAVNKGRAFTSFDMLYPLSLLRRWHARRIRVCVVAIDPRAPSERNTITPFQACVDEYMASSAIEPEHHRVFNSGSVDESLFHSDITHEDLERWAAHARISRPVRHSLHLTNIELCVTCGALACVGAGAALMTAGVWGLFYVHTFMWNMQNSWMM